MTTATAVMEGAETITVNGLAVPTTYLRKAARFIFGRDIYVPYICTECPMCEHLAATWYEPGISSAGDPEAWTCKLFGDFEPWDEECCMYDEALEDEAVQAMAYEEYSCDLPYDEGDDD